MTDSALVVHAYASVDKEVVRDVLANHVDDLLAFAAAVRARLNG